MLDSIQQCYGFPSLILTAVSAAYLSPDLNAFFLSFRMSFDVLGDPGLVGKAVNSILSPRTMLKASILTLESRIPSCSHVSLKHLRLYSPKTFSFHTRAVQWSHIAIIRDAAQIFSPSPRVSLLSPRYFLLPPTDFKRLQKNQAKEQWLGYTICSSYKI